MCHDKMNLTFDEKIFQLQRTFSDIQTNQTGYRVGKSLITYRGNSKPFIFYENYFISPVLRNVIIAK